MGELTDKVKGIANQAIGKAKQTIGGDGKDPDLAAEGAAQEGKGHIQENVGKAKGAVKSAIDKL